MSETQILSVNITLGPRNNFNFADRLSVWEKQGIDMEHVFVSIPLLLLWASITTTSDSNLPIQASFSWPAK